MIKTDFRNILEKSLENIEKDRDKADFLLSDLIKQMGTNQVAHSDVGMIMAKYLETLQRSNEQMVKLVSVMKRKTDDDDEITDADKENIFELIQSERNSNKK